MVVSWGWGRGSGEVKFKVCKVSAESRISSGDPVYSMVPAANNAVLYT